MQLRLVGQAVVGDGLVIGPVGNLLATIRIPGRRRDVHLLSSVNQTLLRWWNTLLLIDLLFDIGNLFMFVSKARMK